MSKRRIRSGHPAGKSPMATVARFLLACSAVFLGPTDALWGQGNVAATVVDESAKKESWNSNGFAVPFDRKVIDRFREFNAHVEQSAWSKAFRLLADLDDGSWTGMLPDGDGFLVPARTRLSQTLRDLPPEGRAAFRVFFEPTARQLMESIKSSGAPPERDARIAETVYYRYFLTDSGDEAADLLGDAYFQRGEFLKAERCWRAILENHPDTSIPEPRLHVKRGISLIRAGQVERFRMVREALALRFAGEKVKVGGSEVNAVAYLDELAAKSGLNLSDLPSKPAADKSELPQLAAPADGTKPLWQFRYRGTSTSAPVEQPVTSVRGARVIVRQGQRAFVVNDQAVNGALASYVPSWAVDERRVYFNWLGACCAVDLSSGRDIWRTQDFALAAQRTMGEDQQIRFGSWMTSSRPFPIAVAEGVVLAGYEGPPNTDAAQQSAESQPLTSLIAYDAETGKQRWRSETVPLLKGSNLLGIPVIRAGEAFVVTQRADSTEWVLRSLDIQSGSERWSVPLGTAQMTADGMYGIQTIPTPTIQIAGNSLFILTNNGALISVSLAERQVEWVYKFETASGGQNSRAMAVRMGMGMSTSLAGPTASLAEREGVLYFKEGANRMLYALDPANRALLWSRPVTAASRIVAIDDDQIYLLADDLMAVDRKTRALLWSIRLPTTLSNEVLLGRETVLVPTSRGIFELSRQKGDRKRIFRGEDVALLGGAMGVVNNKYICISNQAITMYDPTATAIVTPQKESDDKSKVEDSKK